MMRNIINSLQLLFYTLIICCVVYPLSLWVIGQVIFPYQANGSLLRESNGNVIGSALIAQAFVQDEYFHPRPSAANYDASASASSSLAASNHVLRDRVTNAVKLAIQDKPVGTMVPADMVTTSGSGLDPHITLENALFQIDRVSTKWASILNRNQVEIRNEIETLVRNHSSAPLMGLAGEELVNVLEVNNELSKRYKGA